MHALARLVGGRVLTNEVSTSDSIVMGAYRHGRLDDARAGPAE